MDFAIKLDLLKMSVRPNILIRVTYKVRYLPDFCSNCLKSKMLMQWGKVSLTNCVIMSRQSPDVSSGASIVAIKVLVKGSVPHIAGRFFRGAKIITMPRSEFKKEQSALPGQRILYCLQDDESDTDIVMLGTWRSGYFVPESQSLSTTRTWAEARGGRHRTFQGGTTPHEGIIMHSPPLLIAILALSR